MEFLLDFILHIDQYMIDIVQEYGGKHDHYERQNSEL